MDIYRVVHVFISFILSPFLIDRMMLKNGRVLIKLGDISGCSEVTVYFTEKYFCKPDKNLQLKCIYLR